MMHTNFFRLIPPWHLYLDGLCVASWLSLDNALEAAWPLIAECRNVVLVRKASPCAS